MKSMAQMQKEIIANGRWDGGYPRVVHVGMGIIGLARDAEHESMMKRDSFRVHVWGGVTALLLTIGFVVAVATGFL